ncbi:hypothetical protein [Syntrophobotulus glycolicus]|uniref:hypothetical protein n=1 Tax=Syntrophobotulus glycolicus TaxID=51197 RepID=UPI00059C0A3C|nr:hypothetical protein [Syntrophobotulus glycolicus]
MKKLLFLIIIALFSLSLGACANKTENNGPLSKEGIAPYELTEKETYLLDSFGLRNESQIIEFSAPDEAITLSVNVYCLGDDGKWNNTDGGAISIGKEREPVENLKGIFTMALREDYVIDFIINSSGKASYKTKKITLETEAIASVKAFLEEFQVIELNKEIPVALMVYDSGTTMRSYSVQDYFEPAKFEDMDLVQALTLTFSDKQI